MKIRIFRKQVKEPIKVKPPLTSVVDSDMPEFLISGNILTIKGKALPEFADMAWIPFLNRYIDFIKKHKEIVINFDLDYNSSSSRFITDMFRITSMNWPFVKCVVNWYSFPEDENNLANIELYKESNPKITFNLISK